LARSFGDLESFTLGGVNFATTHNVYIGQTDNGLRNEILVPENEIYQEDVFGKHGGYYFGQRYQSRKFSIQCFACEVTDNERRNIQRALSYRTSKQLILSRFPYRYINAFIDGQINYDFIWLKNSDGLDIYNMFFTIPFYCTDPFYYSDFTSLNLPGYVEDHPSYPSLYFESGMRWMEDIPSSSISLSSTPLSSTAISIQQYQGGNYYSQSEFKVVASTECSNIKIKNTTTNQEFTISHLNASEIIRVNGFRGAIYSDDYTALKTSQFSGEFIEIDRDINIIEVTGTGTLASMEIFYRYTYI